MSTGRRANRFRQAIHRRGRQAWESPRKSDIDPVKSFNVSALAVVFVVAIAAQQPAFTPPRLLRGDAPGLPPPTAVGGGQVIVEATIDPSGAPIGVTVLRSTPPFTQMLVDTVSRWRFTPARSRAEDRDGPVQSSVTIVAVYRPPVLTNGPTLGETPRDLAGGSADSPYPVAIVAPNYPPQAFTGGVVVFEVPLDEIGRIQSARVVGGDPGFDSVARQALLQWKFRGGSSRGRPVPTTAYAIFTFSMPIVAVAPGGPPPKPPAK